MVRFEHLTVKQKRRARRLYVYIIRHQIAEGKAEAVITYAQRMQKLGLYSSRTALVDVQTSLLNCYAKTLGYRHVHQWLLATNQKLNDWRMK